MVGTGGVGTGNYFRLNGNHTLGREESRSGRFLDRRDYCKLHIISHYTKVLLGDGFTVYPVGSVGGDQAGSRLLEEMRNNGLDLQFMQILEEKPTLYSFCFLYPDGSGGNLTTDDSASTAVDEQAVEHAASCMAELGPRGIALAAPEVPLRTRLHLLEMAGTYGLYRVASFTREEIPRVRELDLPSLVDLLAVNENEGAAFLGLETQSGEVPEEGECYSTEKGGRETASHTPEQVIHTLIKMFPSISISMTAGVRGSWGWDGKEIFHVPAAEVPVETTGGAGDAHLAGVIAGIVCGLPLSEALEIGTTIAAGSVSSPHTINFEISRNDLAEIASAHQELHSVQRLFRG
jgi:sugar/nucleoside kinase (ribokinase family)